MFERDLLFRELGDINREYETGGRDYFLDISLNNANVIIEESAVKLFNQADKELLYTNLLPLQTLTNKTRENNNKIKTNKIFGIDVPVFLDRLQKYVDFTVIENSLNTKYPQLSIDKSKQLSEIAIEAVHQFQAKIFTSNREWDGVIGASTVSSLGFVLHDNKKFPSDDANDIIKPIFESIDKYIKDYVAGLSVGLPDINGKNWFKFIINPSIFGWNGKTGNGFHLLLILKLRETENELYSPLASELKNLFDREVFSTDFHSTYNFQGKTYGQVPRLMGKALAINEKHSDIRLESDTKTSYHLSGIAIDINHDTNPWIRGEIGLRLINRALRAAKKPGINISRKPGNRQHRLA